GLAAYGEALTRPDRIGKIALIAPGIVPNWFVGEQHPFARGFKRKFNQITMETLTTADYSKGLANPHLEPIKPGSPLEAFGGFAWDLLQTAKEARQIDVPARVRGFVLLSGKNDTYVDAKKTLKVLKKRVPDFGVGFSAKVYPGALHEIDNEVEPIASEAHRDIVDFLTGARQPGQ
ncbi:MAG: hypothetical protein AAB250_06565, partial [Bdellovibrionota bacterium]